MEMFFSLMARSKGSTVQGVLRSCGVSELFLMPPAIA